MHLPKMIQNFLMIFFFNNFKFFQCDVILAGNWNVVLNDGLDQDRGLMHADKALKVSLNRASMNLT